MSLIKFIRIFLLVLIIIGIGLLVTQKMWVPKVVEMILKNENYESGKLPLSLNIVSPNTSQVLKMQNNKSGQISSSVLQSNQISIDNWKLNLPKSWNISNIDKISDNEYKYTIQENGKEVDFDLEKIKTDNSDSDQLMYEIGSGGSFMFEIPNLGDLYGTVGTDSEDPYMIAVYDNKLDLFGYSLDFNFSKPYTNTEIKLLENSLKKISVKKEF